MAKAHRRRSSSRRYRATPGKWLTALTHTLTLGSALVRLVWWLLDDVIHRR